MVGTNDLVNLWAAEITKGMKYGAILEKVEEIKEEIL